MLKYTFDYTTGSEEKDVPENWGETTFKQFLDIYNLPPDADIFDRVSIFTGISVENIKKTKNSSAMIVLADQLSFTYDFGPIKEVANTYDSKWDSWNIGEDEWGKLEAVKAAFTKCDREVLRKFNIAIGTPSEDISKEVKDAVLLNRINAAPIALKEYAGIDANTTPVTECYGLVNFFLHRWESFKNDTRPSVIEM